MIIGFGAGLYLFGSWLTTQGEAGIGWVAYAPLSNTANAADFPGGLLIWLVLVAIWVGTGVVLLRSRVPDDVS